MRAISIAEEDITIEDAIRLQQELASRVLRRTTFDPERLHTVAGVDVGFRSGLARAAVVVCQLPTLQPIAWRLAEAPVGFPYVPGLLAFREGPAVMAAVEGLSPWPDLFIFDAHGIAHPRRLGLAAHIGVLLDCPSIGCAKSRLIGNHCEPAKEKGSWAPLYDGEEVIGAVVRTRAGMRPVYVSIGHRVDLMTAVELVLRCTTRYRLPETTRLAHRLASKGIPPVP